jgi:hypothetical protein
MKKKRPYSERSDADKIQANWTKTCTLFKKREYSVAIIRAATTVEIAVNLVVRQELISRRDLPKNFVDKLMKWANGVIGKLDKILKPLWEETPEGKKKFKEVRGPVARVNSKRNSVVHAGEFKARSTAVEVLNDSRCVILELVTPCEPKFVLKTIAQKCDTPPILGNQVTPAEESK